MSDDFEDFWGDIRPPAPPRPVAATHPAPPRPIAAPRPAPAGVEKGYVWLVPIQDNVAFQGHVPRRVRAVIPEDDGPLVLTAEFQPEAEMVITGLGVYDREEGGELLHTNMFPRVYNMRPGDTFRMTLTLRDEVDPSSAFGVRAVLRLRGLL